MATEQERLAQRRTCFRCVHADVTPRVTFCIRFSEEIDSELFAARDCEAYQEGTDG